MANNVGSTRFPSVEIWAWSTNRVGGGIFTEQGRAGALLVVISRCCCYRGQLQETENDQSPVGTEIEDWSIIFQEELKVHESSLTMNCNSAATGQYQAPKS